MGPLRTRGRMKAFAALRWLVTLASPSLSTSCQSRSSFDWRANLRKADADEWTERGRGGGDEELGPEVETVDDERRAMKVGELAAGPAAELRRIGGDDDVGPREGASAIDHPFRERPLEPKTPEADVAIVRRRRNEGDGKAGDRWLFAEALRVVIER